MSAVEAVQLRTKARRKEATTKLMTLENYQGTDLVDKVEDLLHDIVIEDLLAGTINSYFTTKPSHATPTEPSDSSGEAVPGR